MNSKTARTLGLIFLFFAVLSLIFALVTKPPVEDRIAESWSGSSGSYSCAGETGVADRIEAMERPSERATDPATGDTYLRYPKKLVIVAGEGTSDCRITIEGLERVNNGAFIWLGPGFVPSAPSNSSGGSSGSSGGVK
ncbi:hypothetical protein CFAEC_11760 [Corynebacterium faecale]|uniref:DUF4247 domain-containing protein n=1 Tax=Corynebacterium faecale TaxID=1758466 RepID=UPI0025B47FE9|nr:DUF4247 domain-containing protein [Corynebacterium faecale]WJY93144.1 hypothetical protein CFAEC_11760 [Corynebacterium faecale]